MKYYIEVESSNKAKSDIDEICRREGYGNVTALNCGKSGAGRFMTKLLSVTSLLFKLRKDDVLFLQYPMKKFYFMACSLAKMRKAHVVTVIHDLGAFRRHKLTPEKENRRLSKTDFIIAHNPTMRDYLIKNGFKGGIHCLQIFDYLSPVPLKEKAVRQRPRDNKTWNVIYAGNLGNWRNGFLYKLAPVMKGWDMDLYGKGFDNTANACEQIRYHGFINSDDFIEKVEGDFGLVWDGDSIERCTGDWGEYLRINDPHKTSFYLRAGMPVIVWREAAMAPFIEEQRIGFAVDGLAQIAERLSVLSPEEYAEMSQNALAMSTRLNEGYFIKQGMAAAGHFLKTRQG